MLVNDPKNLRQQLVGSKPKLQKKNKLIYRAQWSKRAQKGARVREISPAISLK